MSRAQRLIDEAYAIETRWTPENAAAVLDHHAWVLDDALATLDAQRVRVHRFIEQKAIELRARHVGTPEQRSAALAKAHVLADAELDRRQALISDVYRVHTHRSADA